jgi:hypothetical protein
MKVAVKHDAVLVDAEGVVTGHDAGATLVRRLLRVFPGSVRVGPGPRRCAGFDMLPLEFVDGRDTVVISMDVIDSVHVWQTLHGACEEPHVMNFVWWNATRYPHDVERSAVALSCALFPTFANSARTASEVREVVARWTVPPLAAQAKIAWVNLGFRREHVRPRHDTDVPVVLYPAIYVSERKQPRLFLEVVDRVHRRTPIRVEARLHEHHLVSDMAMKMSARDWAWVGPLTASRDSYWDALSRTTAFLATATEESYGLEYVEALAAGAIGVFPDLPWVRSVVPDAYPFRYGTPAEATELLHRAVTEPETCRQEMDAAVGGSFVRWVAEHHDDDAFEQVIVRQVRTWFPAL